MLKGMTTALLAAALSGSPVLAQSTIAAAHAPATQPLKPSTIMNGIPVFAMGHSRLTKAKAKNTKVEKLKTQKIKKNIALRGKGAATGSVFSGRPSTRAHQH